MNPNPFTQSLLELANFVVPLGANLLVQSTLLITAGLVAAHFCRRQGAALQSLILRVTLVAVLGCPLVSFALGAAGIEGANLRLPVAGDRPVPPGLAAQQFQAMDQASDAPLNPSGDRSGQGVPDNGDANALAANSTGAQRTSNPAPSASAPAIGGASLNGLSLLYCALALGWFVGALALLVPLLVCHIRIGRLRWQAGMADVEVFERCQAIARNLNVPSPEVLSHPGVKSPLLVGLFRPAILLPQLKEHLHVVATREVLLHELAHLARRDCLWHLLGRLAMALLFFQPLLWLLARGLEETAEEVCDNYVIERLPDRRAYARQLADLAERLKFHRAEAAVGVGVIAFKSALGQRIVRILDDSRRLSVRAGTRSKIGIALAGILATSVASLFGAASAPFADAQPQYTEANSGQPSQAVQGDDATETSSAAKLTAGRVGSPIEAAVSSAATSPGLSLRILPVPAEPKMLSYDLLYNDLTLLADGRLMTSGDRNNTKVLQLSGGTIRVATNPVLPNKSLLSPRFSADGKQMVAVAFESGNSVGTRQIVLVNLEGLEPQGESRVLYQNDAAKYLQVTDWSEDGQTVLCILRAQGDWHIATVSVADGTARDAKTSFRGNSTSKMRFSPDGRWIAYEQYERAESSVRDLYLLSADGSGEVPLAQSPADDYLLGWTPTGDRILFASNRRRSWDAFAIQIIDGKPVGEPQLLKEGIGRVKPLGFTSTGAFLYRVETNTKDVYVVPLDPLSGKINGTATRVPFGFEGRTGEPDWSRDGRFLACEVMDAGPGSATSSDIICIRNMSDGTERELKCEGGPVFRPVWSPTGASFIAGQGTGLRQIDALTGESISLTTSSRSGAPAGWDADGKAFYYPDPANQTIVRYEIETGAETKFPLADNALDATDRWFSLAKLSPDGRQAAYLRGNWDSQAIFLATLNDGLARKLADIPGPRYGNVYFLVWTPDSRYVMFKGSRKMRGEPWFTTFWRVSAATGEIEEMGKVEGHSDFNFCISPDGRQVAFTIGESSRNIWLMENFLPSPTTAAQ